MKRKKDNTLYLDKDQIQELVNFKNMILEHRNNAYKKCKVDILSNDILSSLSMYDIIFEYDKDYNPNFHRNGADGKSKDVLIERKCAKANVSKKGLVKDTGWIFHAQETKKATRYIFGVRNAETLDIVKIYDIDNTKVIEIIDQCLEDQRQKWIAKGKPNHDGIIVKEKLLATLEPKQVLSIKNCKVYKY